MDNGYMTSKYNFDKSFEIRTEKKNRRILPFLVRLIWYMNRSKKDKGNSVRVLGWYQYARSTTGRITGHYDLRKQFRGIGIYGEKPI